jgi:Flp pilus assembly protein TadG
MISALRRLFRSMVGVADLSGHFVSCTTGTAAVEAAIFAPIFLIMTLGVTDLGSGMFVRMSVNAATQAGAAYAVIKSSCTPKPCTPICASLTTACHDGIATAMNDATGISSFCTGTVCTPSITGCADGSPKCISVSVNYPFTPILPDVVYSWAQSMTISSSTIIRML